MGPVNSARGPLVLLKSQILRLKKKKEMQTLDIQTLNPNAA